VRTTASVHHNLEFTSGRLASSLIWGRNKNLKNGTRRIFNSYGLETTAKFRSRNWIWIRFENVDRDRSLLPVSPAPQNPTCLLCGIVGFNISSPDDFTKPTQSKHVVLDSAGRPTTIEEEPIGRVQAYTFGYEREVPVGLSWLNVGLGGQVTTYGLPAQLKKIYGNRPSTFVAFLRIRPKGNMTEHMRQMHRR